MARVDAEKQMSDWGWEVVDRLGIELVGPGHYEAGSRKSEYFWQSCVDGEVFLIEVFD